MCKLNQRIEIEKVLQVYQKNHIEPTEKIQHLVAHGTNFSLEKWNDYPPDIPRAQRTRRRGCHLNNLFYAVQLMNYFKGDSSAFAFVTGVYGFAAKTDIPLDEARYLIGSHTFLVYENKILDCTELNHPSEHYFNDQYFGIAYNPRIAIRTVKKLCFSGEDFIPLDGLRHQHCIS